MRSRRSAICCTIGLAFWVYVVTSELVELSHPPRPNGPEVLWFGPQYTYQDHGHEETAGVGPREPQPVAGQTGGSVVVTPGTASVQASGSAPLVVIGPARA